MNDETSGITAVILAGGRGKRIGQNKALLKIGDVYLLEIVLKTSGQSLTTYCLSSLRLTTITSCPGTFLSCPVTVRTSSSIPSPTRAPFLASSRA